jgi:hypothetical protein
MNKHPEHDSSERTVDPVLAELAEQLTRQLQAGDVIDIDRWCRQYPRWAGAIRRMLPTLRQLTRLDEVSDPAQSEDALPRLAAGADVKPTP